MFFFSFQIMVAIKKKDWRPSITDVYCLDKGIDTEKVLHHSQI